MKVEKDNDLGSFLMSWWDVKCTSENVESNDSIKEAIL